ncbi:MAG: NAD(P)-dependent oxidoreductase [Pseudomonadota bacterium]|nr:NAD(P)-dependent oxidoreductase [Pseudomonadota bacterium]
MRRERPRNKERETPHMDPVGVIGLGLMGSVLVSRLRSAGFPVMAHDVDPAKRAAAEAGGAVLALPAAMAAACGCIVLALFDTAQVEEVVEQSLMPAAGGGRPIILCTSTCDPDAIAALSDRLAASGLRFLEAPISGTSEQVRQGDGVALIGGDPEHLEAAAPVLRALFATSHHVGRCGDGNRGKLAINLVLGLNRLALAEGMAFAERLGMNPAAFLTVARQSAAYSQVMDTKGAKMANGDFAPQGRARQTLKDARLILDLAARHGQDLPLEEVNAAILDACVAAGDGDLDNSVVFRELRRRRAGPVSL